MNMKTKIIIALALLALTGCTEHPTYAMVEKVRAKYPGCEVIEENSIVATVFVRTKDGEIRRITFSDRQEITSETIIFNRTSP